MRRDLIRRNWGKAPPGAECNRWLDAGRMCGQPATVALKATITARCDLHNPFSRKQARADSGERQELSKAVSYGRTTDYSERFGPDAVNTFWAWVDVLPGGPVADLMESAAYAWTDGPRR
jgi:hypothetical protein